MAENGTPSEIEQKIIKQIEFYFGDINLPRDKFMQEQLKEDDGWVTMETMLKFKRLKAISDDKELICLALKKSSSGLMEVSEDHSKIRRCPEKNLPDFNKERKDEINNRSVYVKGFPEGCSRDSLTEFFEKHGKVEYLDMLHSRPEKKFKGKVFVTFSTKDEAEKLVAEEKMVWESTELFRQLKVDFIKQKTNEAKEKKQSDKNDSDKKNEMKQENQEKKLEEQMTKGAVLFMKGLPKEITLDEIRTFFSDYGKVAWVEYATGDEKALVRFNEDAQSALDKAKEAGSGKLIVKDAELESRVLEGEEEKEYWRKMFSDMAERRNRPNKNFHNRKRKFGGKPFKKGGRDNDDGAPAAKKTKESD